MNAFTALVAKDLRLYFTNRRAVVITLAAPILIAAFFGAVLGGAPKKPSAIPIAIVDADASPVSKSFAASIKADATFDVRDTDAAQAQAMVRAGKVRAAIVVPKGFGDAAPRALFSAAAAKPQIELLVDPSQLMAIEMVKGVVVQHAMKAVSVAVAGPAAPRGGFAMPFEFRQTDITGGNRKYNAYSHSFAGMGVQFVLFMGIELGVGVLLMRRMGIWRRLRAAPVSRTLLLGSRIASGTLIASLLLAAIYAAGITFFQVRVDGSLAGLVGIVLAFAVMTATFGLLIAAVGRTPEATRGLAILATLLLVMLGGAWVPSFVFPDWLQSATLWVPTRWAIDGLEAMTWRGQGFDAAIAPIGVLLAFSALFGVIAVRRFSWDE